ncbi:MAG: hypothetical protein LC114_21870 [Bryobacterales bacterium]|nr:hypothetical protein [Bryobacterales bacterium]
MAREATITIIRTRRRRRFVVLAQEAVDDERLSWAARGLLHYLLGRPDDWKVLVRDLQRRGDLRRDGIYKLLKELRSVGYAQYVSMRDELGRIRGGTYYIYEQPSPLPANPEVLPITDEKIKRTTTTTKQTTTYHGRRDREQGAGSVEFASWVPEDLRASARNLVKALDQPRAQLVLDEWAGLIMIGAIHTSPLGYLSTLVRRILVGEFTVRYAEEVAAIRQDYEHVRPVPG